jgi:hypothetical protein
MVSGGVDMSSALILLLIAVTSGETAFRTEALRNTLSVTGGTGERVAHNMEGVWTAPWYRDSGSIERIPGRITRPKRENRGGREIPGHKSARPGFPLLPGDEFLLDTSIVHVPSPFCGWSVAVAFDGTNYLVVWEDSRTDLDSSDIWGARVTPQGEVLDRAGIPISTAGAQQSSPSVAFDGTNYLVVWEDNRNDSYGDLYGTRVDTSGRILDSAGILISLASGMQRDPAVVFGGLYYLVVWMDCRAGCDVYGARVSPDGTVLDPGGEPISAASGDQARPHVAFDGTNYFVVWSDERSGEDDIYGTRVAQTGAILDPLGVPICTAPDDQRAPSVAFCGPDYLVVWMDIDSDKWDIYGARVNAFGVVMDPAGIAISTAPDWQSDPSVAFDGENFFVVWDDRRAGWDSTGIYGARVDISGAVLDTEGIVVCNTSGDQEYPAMGFDGTNHLVVWKDDCSGGVCGSRVMPSGVILDTSGFPVSTAAHSQWFPSAAFNGADYLIAWGDFRGGGGVYGTRVDSSGVVLDPTGIAISTEARPNYFWGTSVASDGNNYLVVWQDARNGEDNLDVYAARVSSSGAVLDEIPISTLPGWQFGVSAAFGVNNYFVVWSDESARGIQGTRVTPSGAVLDPGGIAVASSGMSPSIAFDGSNYFVAWFGASFDSGAILGARVDTSGVVMDTQGILISYTADPYYISEPSVAFDGSNYLVVWNEYDQEKIMLCCVRVAPSGTVLDPEAIVLSTEVGYSRASAAFDGTNYLMVWEDYRYGLDNTDVYGIRVDTSCTVIDSFAVTAQIGYQFYPIVVSDGNGQVLAAWSGWTPAPYNTGRAWGKLSPFSGVEESRKPTSKRQEARLAISPNPFIRSAVISYSSFVNSETTDNSPHVVLKIHDITGRVVKTLVNEKREQGKDSIAFNAEKQSAGIYFVKLTINGSQIDSKKLILVK